ncbi:hypothetical protein QAD02_023330 [Eretmocerus hayati]|uniref:Uncharacterized protein n=1 Tax=Eretmocerus hayati TaxID=131215 RepID=A0ACC2PXN0_9HYME|nr:hypothetical protein QAD02_023330 [Eretmocerus hayati]
MSGDCSLVGLILLTQYLEPISDRNTLVPRTVRTRSASPRTYPTFNKSLLSTSTRLNGRLQLQCDIRGSPKPSTIWFRNGSRIEHSSRIKRSFVSDRAVLTISDVKFSDAGEYSCEAKNLLGTTRSSCKVAVLDVDDPSTKDRDPPKFLQLLPTESIVMEGHSYELQTRLKGSPPYIISWFKDGHEIFDSDYYRHIVYEDGGVALRFLNVYPLDAGDYTCLVKNEFGEARCRGLFVVQDYKSASSNWMLSFLKTPVPVFVEKGETACFCARIQSERSVEIDWTINGKSAREDYRYKVERDGSTSILRIPHASHLDCGEIRVTASISRGPSISSSAQLRLKPSFPAASKLRANLMRLLEPCKSRSLPKLKACSRQKLNGLYSTPNLLRISSERHLGHNNRNQRSSSSTSRLSPSKKRESSIENVDTKSRKRQLKSPPKPLEIRIEPVEKVHNENLVRVKRSAEVEVERKGMMDDGGFEKRKKEIPALVIRQPEDVVTLRGATVTLEAIYQGSPEPSVKWMRAGRELVADKKIKIESKAGVSRLTLYKITADQAGKYAVSVENALGSDCRFASVAVEGPPDAPVDPPVVLSCPRRAGSKTGEDGCGCLVTWCSPPYDGGCALSGYTVEQRRCGESSWLIVAENCHSLSHELPSKLLKPGNSYVFRVRAVNPHGPSEPSPESRPFRLAIIVDMGDAEDKLKYEERQASMESENGELDSLDKIVTPEDGQLFKERYILHEELGKGRYGVVRRVVEKKSAKSYAAKFVRTIKLSDRQQVQEEIKIMNMLRHPKLLRLAAAFESQKEIVMVTEYISGGELFERVVADDFTLTEKDSILFMRQICEGVRYMHENNVVHLDLKPENIMCHTRTSHRIKLIDFGLAQILNPNKPVRVLFGTPEFIPPEIISYEPIGTESDMWSVGVICYVLLTGLSPFMGDNDAETFANIVRADYDFEDEAFDAISADAKDFISNLLQKKKELRMSAKQCLGHSWLAQHTENMSRVALSTDKLKKFIVRRKWQKTGNALRALGRMAMLSANRRSPSISSTSSHSLSESSRSDSLDSEHLEDSLRLGSSFERSISHESKSENGEEITSFPSHRVIDDILEEEVESSSKERTTGESEKDICEVSVIDNNANAVGIVRAVEVRVDEEDVDGDTDDDNNGNGNREDFEYSFGRDSSRVSTVEEPGGSSKVDYQKKNEDVIRRNNTEANAVVDDLVVDYSRELENSNKPVGIISSKSRDSGGVKHRDQNSKTTHKNNVTFAIDEPSREKSTSNGRVGRQGLNEIETYKPEYSTSSKDELQGFERDLTRRSYHRFNPTLGGATSIEESRIDGSSTSRGKYTLTGNVSRTARLFENLDTTQTSDSHQQNINQGITGAYKDSSPSSTSSASSASVKARTERIQRAFAFWNK